MNNPGILIAYFSRAGLNYLGGRIVDLRVGNTELAMRYVEAHTGGALRRIEALEPYPEGYDEATEVAKAELRKKARPRLKNPVLALPECAAIVLGYPNWWGTMPMPV